MKKRYIIRQQDDRITKRFQERFDIPAIVAKILQNRGLTTEEQVEEYLNTNIEKLRNPLLIPGIDDAVRLLDDSIMNNDKVFIYGDYDADGVTSTAQLVLILKEINADFEYHLPDREVDGYGLNDVIAEILVEKDVKLLITLDCGISNYDEISKVVEKGIRVIIIDHHQCPDRLPPADVIVDPQISETQTYYQNLCGAGLAFNFVRALIDRRNLQISLDPYLQLAAIGTVSDIVPITRENRIIVKNGIDKINSNPLPGLEQLLHLTNVTKGSVTTDTLSYMIGPKINAAGRVDKAETALKMLISSDRNESNRYAQQLNDLNTLRKEIEKQIFDEADNNISSQLHNKILIAYGNEWHEGVIGIVSSKLTEKYHKPSIMFSRSGSHFKGSGRSIPGFDIYKAIKVFDHLTLKSGGHQQAVGLTIHEDNFTDFIGHLTKYTNELMTDGEMVKEIAVDAVVSKEDRIDISSVDTINRIFEPYGLRNEKPVFMINQYELQHQRYLGNDENHLKAGVKLGNSVFTVLRFNITELEKKEFSRLNPLVGEFDVNHYNGFSSVQFNVIDFAGDYFTDLKLKLLYEIANKPQFAFSEVDKIESHCDRLIFQEDILSIRNASGLEDLNGITREIVECAISRWVPSKDSEEKILIELGKNHSKIFKFEMIKLVN
ncbi:MAG: single-stranded-DNA-specific exonuclease RecJ, partial [Eubacteriales bacterium]|nr:single-stranded-DNA-specific exonuclease RecJ [Eubacteriales bacterium]